MSAGVAMAVALGLLIGPPASGPPKVGGTISVAPPPAWIEVGARSRWLAYGSYCWGTACVDMLPPESRPDLPRVNVTPGRMLRVHFAFEPSRASVHLLRATRWVRLASIGGRTLSFRARRGILIVDASGARGSASYVARLVSSVSTAGQKSP